MILIVTKFPDLLILEIFGNSLDFGNEALVLMASGIFSNWKQTIAYVISNEATPASVLFEILIDCIDRLQKVGLYVKLIVCDQGTTNQSLLTYFLKVSHIKPFFEVNKVKIYTMFDPPHLLKYVRNMLKLHDFCLNDTVICWKYISQLYDLITSNYLAMRLVPKLTKSHITLPPFAKMKVKRAAQVFSNTCYCAIVNHICNGALPHDAFATANFIKRMDSLFDCFNSSNISNAKPFKCALKENSNHHDFLIECKEIFTNLYYYDSRGRECQPPCFQGWVLSITALSLLWNDLKNVSGVEFLLTRRLSQYCLENLFSVIRGKGGFRDNPGPKHFCDTLKQTMVTSLLDLSHSEGANCQMDTAKCLFDIGTINSVSPPPEPYVVSLDDDCATPVLDLPQSNILFYGAGVCLKKIIKTHRQCDCLGLLKQQQATLTSSNQIFTACKAYSKYGDDFGALNVPSDNLVILLQSCDNIFVKNFPKIIHMDQICTRLENLVFVRNDVKWFSCSAGNCLSVLQSIVRSFFRLRIYYVLKGLNQKVAAAPKKKQNRTTEIDAFVINHMYIYCQIVQWWCDEMILYLLIILYHTYTTRNGASESGYTLTLDGATVALVTKINIAVDSLCLCSR